MAFLKFIQQPYGLNELLRFSWPQLAGTLSTASGQVNTITSNYCNTGHEARGVVTHVSRELGQKLGPGKC